MVGKIRALAAHDFKELIELRTSTDSEDGSIEITNLLFLHAQFWSRIQILRQESLFVNLAKSQVGKKLVAFLETLESRGVRIADRAYQRGMGESLLQARGDSLASITYYEFVDRYVTSAQLRSWFQPLIERISGLDGSQARQSFLVYAAVVHALVDTLDPKHLTDRERLGFPNKLTRKNRQLLKYQVFGTYLKFVKAPEKYFETGYLR